MKRLTIEQTQISKIKLKEIINAWTAEIISDIISVNLVGPAFLWAFCDFITASKVKIDNPTPSHPPNRLRIKIIIQELKKLNWEKSIKKYAGDQWQEILEILQSLPRHEIVDENEKKLNEAGQTYIEKSLEYIRTYVDASISSSLIVKIGNVSKHNKSIARIIEALQHQILPFEHFEEGKIQSRNNYVVTLLNAAWFYYLNNIDEWYQRYRATSEEEKVNVDLKYQQIIMKCIEDSKVYEAYHEQGNL